MSSFLAHKYAGGRLFRANYYGTEVKGRFYTGDVSGAPRTRLKMDFTTLEGKTVSIPGKDARDCRPFRNTRFRAMSQS